MIQRVQTLYLSIATILSGVVVFFLDLWETAKHKAFSVLDTFATDSVLLKSITILFVVSAVITFITIFKYKTRKTQFVLGRLSILINLILLGILVYYVQNLSGEITVSEKGIGLLIPIFTILFIVLANRAIKKDEELVKSVDRLR
ncbi:MAG: DUF4293 domain-containing protein [Flavobacteriaceae bacterium]|nr:DUF4293 domain-containing protein [Flavobacteriaceae bacterium]